MTPFTLLYLDIRRFSSINHRYGRQIGNRLLRQFADFLEASLRRSDILGRWEKDDFLIIATETPCEGGQTLASRLAENLRRTRFKVDNLFLQLAVLVGFLCVEQFPGDGPNDLVARLQEALRHKLMDGEEHCLFQVS